MSFQVSSVFNVEHELVLLLISLTTMQLSAAFVSFAVLVSGASVAPFSSFSLSSLLFSLKIKIKVPQHDTFGFSFTSSNFQTLARVTPADDANDSKGCIFTQNLIMNDATADEINASLAGVSSGSSTTDQHHCWSSQS